MTAVAQGLHRVGVHTLCREVREYASDWPAYRLDDGTLWKPDITGLPMLLRRYHVSRFERPLPPDPQPVPDPPA